MSKPIIFIMKDEPTVLRALVAVVLLDSSHAASPT